MFGFFRGFQHFFTMGFHGVCEFAEPGGVSDMCRLTTIILNHLALLRWILPSSGLTQLPGFDLLKEYYDSLNEFV